ncbi:unnamed protein product [Cylindrotheca closterium]|uniref:Uncharacterized protein n=1 Tax=Cylindrotheca closterium TaxID=2856 RepID=A0AAD2FTB3_9STRA|nr:unnamed protein product [Cylindrotheca closterium]
MRIRSRRNEQAERGELEAATATTATPATSTTSNTRRVIKQTFEDSNQTNEYEYDGSVNKEQNPSEGTAESRIRLLGNWMEASGLVTWELDGGLEKGRGAEFWFCTVNPGLFGQGFSPHYGDRQTTPNVIQCCVAATGAFVKPTCLSIDDPNHYDLVVVNWCLSPAESPAIIKALVNDHIDRKIRCSKLQGQPAGRRTAHYALVFHKFFGYGILIFSWWNCYTGLVRISPADAFFQLVVLSSYSIGYDLCSLFSRFPAPTHLKATMIQMIDFFTIPKKRSHSPNLFLVWILENPNQNYNEWIGLEDRVKPATKHNKSKFKWVVLYSSSNAKKDKKTLQKATAKEISKRKHEGPLEGK